MPIMPASLHAQAAIRPDSAISLYFGKIPSRGDFVKSLAGARIVALVDNWVALGIEMLAANPHWKRYYDSAEPIDFLFLSPHRGRAICGTLITSGDASARRFPFIAATLFEVDGALAFLPLSPLLLERHANRQRALARHAASSQDANDALSALDGMQLDVEPAAERFLAGYRQFLAITAIAGLDKQLANGNCSSVRQMVLAIGFLLQPVLTNYAQAPQKGLSIPLPGDPAQAVLAKALWLDLIQVFLPRAEFELGIFCGAHFGVPRLIVTFNGASPAVFHALYDEQAAAEILIDVGQAQWVEEFVGGDAAAYKLSGYLEHADLPLQHLVDTFRQSFSG